MFNFGNGKSIVDGFRATVTDSRTVTLDKLPGENLWQHMNRGTLTPRMLKAAGHEYRRAHRFQSRKLGSGWSHREASMINVVYDEKTKRARLIDFEIRHEKSLPARARHADDLLVFLLDLVGRIPTRQWLPFAICFLRAYGSAGTEGTFGCSERAGLDLVECANEFHAQRKSEPAVQRFAPRDR